MWARALCTVLPCGSTTAFFGVIMILAFKPNSLRRRQQDEVPATVFPISGFIVAGVHRAIFAVADRVGASWINAQADQFFTQRQRPALTEGPVILLRSALVAIAFNPDGVGRGALQVV